MLHLLLDEHLSTTIAKQVRARNPAIAIVSMHEWHEGSYLGTADEKLLEAAHAERLTLVTYDQQTIRPLLHLWGAKGKDHSGVVFVSNNTIASRDFGGLIRAVANLWYRYQDQDWLNKITYLERAP